MSNWRAVIDEALGRNTRDERNDSDPTVPSVPSVPIVPPMDPARALKLWRASLAKVDPRGPMHGYKAAAWCNLCDDAVWLLGNFGEQAARDGWSTGDLFGLWPGKPGWGGIADRLCGCRALVMSADRSSWRAWGQVERYNRGSYPNLRAFWEREA